MKNAGKFPSKENNEVFGAIFKEKVQNRSNFDKNAICRKCYQIPELDG